MMRSRRRIQDNDQFNLLNTLVAYMVTDLESDEIALQAAVKGI